jgi:hypothetical protein
MRVRENRMNPSAHSSFYIALFSFVSSLLCCFDAKSVRISYVTGWSHSNRRVWEHRGHGYNVMSMFTIVACFWVTSLQLDACWFRSLPVVDSWVFRYVDGVDHPVVVGRVKELARRCKEGVGNLVSHILDLINTRLEEIHDRHIIFL